MKFCAYMAKGHMAYLMLIIIFFYGCKKENKDSNAPDVHFHVPSEGSIFFYYNLIPVKAHIIDDQVITSVEVNVTDAQNRIYLNAINRQPNTKEFELDNAIAHDDLYLESGTYFIRIKASDGENTTTVYKEIQLFEAPRQVVKKIATRSDGSTSSADSLSEGMNLHWFDPGGFQFGSINSRTNELVITNNTQTQIQVIDLSALQPGLVNSFTPSGGSSVTCSFFETEKRDHLFGLSDGNFIRYNSSGFQQNVTSSGEVTRHILATEQWIYSISSPLLLPAETQINVYNRESGALLQSLPVGFEVKGITPATNEDEIFIVGNTNESAVFRKYFRNANGINDVFSFHENTPVISFAAGDEHNFYVAHTSGIGYYMNNMQAYQVNSALHPDKIIYDPVESLVYLVTDAGIYVMNESCSQQVDFIAGNQFQDVLFLYNK